MRKTTTIILVILILLLAAWLLLFLDINLLFMGVPSTVYFENLVQKSTYNCGNECFGFVAKCSETGTGKGIYEVSSGYIFGWGDDNYYWDNGSSICSFHWNIDMRDSQPDFYKKAGCPNVSNCEKMIQR